MYDYEAYFNHFCEAMGLSTTSFDSVIEFLIFLNFRLRDFRTKEVAEARASKRLPLLQSPHRMAIFKVYKSRRYSFWGKLRNTPKKFVFRLMYKLVEALVEAIEATARWLL